MLILKGFVGPVRPQSCSKPLCYVALDTVSQIWTMSWLKEASTYSNSELTPCVLMFVSPYLNYRLCSNTHRWKAVALLMVLMNRSQGDLLETFEEFVNDNSQGSVLFFPARLWPGKNATQRLNTCTVLRHSSRCSSSARRVANQPEPKLAFHRLFFLFAWLPLLISLWLILK